MDQNVIAIAACVFALGCIFGLGGLLLAARLIERFARATSLIQAQQDEHVKVFMCFAEKATSRLMAAAMPRSYQGYRTNSAAGPVPDGLQHVVKPQFSLPFPEVQQNLDEQRRRIAVQAEALAAAQRAEMLPMQEIPVGTPMDFENHPRRNGAEAPP